MDQVTWLTYTDPEPMLEFLRRNVSDRKLRLVGVACCRSVWHLIRDQRYRAAAEVAERFADGLASDAERQAAQRAITNVPGQVEDSPGRHGAHSAAWYAAGADPWDSAWYARRHAQESKADEAVGDFNWWRRADQLEDSGVDSREAINDARAELDARRGVGRERARRSQVKLLHCIVGPLPFRSVVVDPAWRTATVWLIRKGAIDGARELERLARFAHR